MKSFISTYFKDQEVIFIVLYNVITLVSYHIGELQPIYVLWAYFLQSLFIGARYWFLEVYKQIRAKKKQWFLVFFFPMHFGGFHFAYLVFLFFMGSGSDLSGLADMLKINLLILVVQFVVFIIREVSNGTPDHSMILFFAPYVRIIPMHIIIILGFNSGIGIYAFDIFIVLKTFMDLISFRWFDRRETAPRSAY